MLVSIDTLYATKAITDFISKEAKERLKIKKEHIFIGASHTHYAPFLDRSKPKLGFVNDEYESFFLSKLSKLVNEIFTKDLQPILLSLNKKFCDLNINRNKKVWFRRKKIIP